jgi:hypothetical protein
VLSPVHRFQSVRQDQAHWARTARGVFDPNLSYPVPAQERKIQCRRLTTQPPCGLRLFYNTSFSGLPDPATWGVDVGVLPRHGPIPGGEVLPFAADAYNRTESAYNSTMWPLLYFYGGPGCSVLLGDPVILGVNFPGAPKQASPVGAEVWGSGFNPNP